MSEKKQKSKLVRFVIRPLLTILTILLVLVLALLIFINPIVKFVIENVASELAGVDMKIESIRVSPLQGRVEIRDFVVSNPADKGYATPHVAKLGLVNAEIVPLSVLDPKIVIKELTLKDVDINYEYDLLLNSNVQDIIDNLNTLAGTSGKDKKKEEKKVKKKSEGKNLQVDLFVMDNVRLASVLKGGSVSLPVTITIDPMKDLGTEPEGMSPVTFGVLVFSEILVSGASQAGIKVSDGAIKAADAAVAGGKKLVDESVETVKKAGEELKAGGEKALEELKNTGKVTQETMDDLKNTGKNAVEDLKKGFGGFLGGKE